MAGKKKQDWSETRLYHVSSMARLASIRECGLNGEFTKVRPGFIHLGASAFQVGIYHGHWNEGPSLLMSVRIGDIDQSRLGPDREDLMDVLDQNGDDRDWDEIGWLESLRISGNCTYEGAIPVSALRVDSYVPNPECRDEVPVCLPLNSWSGPDPAPTP